MPKLYNFNEPVISQTALITLAEKVNKRLGFMKDVAGFKAQLHMPIEDVVQEYKVINNSLTEAESLGLDPESVRPFIVAQIDAAKAIQYRYRADWLAVPEIDWKPQPLDDVRQKVAQLSSEILQQLAFIGELGLIDRNERNGFVLQLEQNNLSFEDKERLFDALLFVRHISMKQ